MSWTDLVSLISGGGLVSGLGVLAYVFLKLHQSAIAAHREARDGWKALALEREKQLMEILGAVREAKDKVP